MFNTNKRVKYNYLPIIDSISIAQFTLCFFNTQYDIIFLSVLPLLIIDSYRDFVVLQGNQIRMLNSLRYPFPPLTVSLKAWICLEFLF